MSKKYFCDRCGAEVCALICEEHGYHDLCFDCKAVLDQLKSWEQYKNRAIKRLGGGQT